jgi:cephalosporin hydroxylase
MLDKKEQLQIGRTIFGIPCQQYWQDLFYLEKLITAHEPKTVIEIGTGTGASAAFFANFNSVFNTFSFDIVDRRKIRPENVIFWQAHIFQPGTIRELAQIIESYRDEKLFIFCDGGDKTKEFLLFAPFLKIGDCIAVHDWKIEADASKIYQVAANCGLTAYRHDLADRIDTLVRGWYK